MAEIKLLPADSISVHSRSLLGWLIRKAERGVMIVNES